MTWSASTPIRSFTVTGHRPGIGDGGADDVTEECPVDREGGPGPLPGDLAGRAPEVEVDVVDADLVDQAADGQAHDRRVDTGQLHTADGLVLTERGHPHGLGVAFDQGAGGDHLAHVQARPVAPAQGAEGTVGDPGHRGQYHRQVDDQVAQFEHGRRHRELSRHRSVMLTPRSPRSERRAGSDSPITLPGSPTMPSRNGAEWPSNVKAPATSRTPGTDR